MSLVSSRFHYFLPYSKGLFLSRLPLVGEIWEIYAEAVALSICDVLSPAKLFGTFFKLDRQMYLLYALL